MRTIENIVFWITTINVVVTTAGLVTFFSIDPKYIINSILMATFTIIGAFAIYFISQKEIIGYKICFIFYLLQVAVFEFSFGSIGVRYGFGFQLTWNLFILNLHLNVFAVIMAVLTKKSLDGFFLAESEKI